MCCGRKSSWQLDDDVFFFGMTMHHATILGRGYLLATISVVSAQDQVAFISDGYECLMELNEVIYSSNDVPIVDTTNAYAAEKIRKREVITL